MSSRLVTGLGWSFAKSQYQEKFQLPVPQWVLVMDLHKQQRLLRSSIKIGIPLAGTVLVAGEFLDY